MSQKLGCIERNTLLMKSQKITTIPGHEIKDLMIRHFYHKDREKHQILFHLGLGQIVLYEQFCDKKSCDLEIRNLLHEVRDQKEYEIKI